MQMCNLTILVQILLSRYILETIRYMSTLQLLNIPFSEKNASENECNSVHIFFFFTLYITYIRITLKADVHFSLGRLTRLLQVFPRQQ